jgi:hypothetical protein
MMRQLHRISALFVLLLFVVSAQGTETWPQGLSFVGLSAERWQLYVVLPSALKPQIVETVLEPRTPTYAVQTGKIAYLGADGSLRVILLETGEDRIVLKPDAQRTLAQPAYDAAGKRLFVVALKEGASVDTDILVLSEDKPKSVVTQRSAQFEPYFHAPRTLYYSNILCTIGCGKIIQEIWRKDLVSGEAEQITLLNAIARQPIISREGQWLYFSSNKAGNFHIWRMSLETGRYERLTEGRVTDINPAFDRQGNLYFIRHTPTGTTLMQRRTDGTLQTLPKLFENVRDLEISP